MDRSALDAAQPVVYASDAARIAALRGVVLDEPPPPSGSEEPYCWAEGGDPNPSLPKLVRHNLHWIAFSVLHAMEFVGDFFTNTLGLTNSRYEWAMELARQQEEEREERDMAEQRQARWAEIRALREAEERSNAAGGAAAPLVSTGEGGQGLSGQEEGQEEEGEEDEGEEAEGEEEADPELAQRG